MTINKLPMILDIDTVRKLSPTERHIARKTREEWLKRERKNDKLEISRIRMKIYKFNKNK